MTNHAVPDMPTDLAVDSYLDAFRLREDAEAGVFKSCVFATVLGALAIGPIYLLGLGLTFLQVVLVTPFAIAFVLGSICYLVRAYRHLFAYFRHHHRAIAILRLFPDIDHDVRRLADEEPPRGSSLFILWQGLSKPSQTTFGLHFFLPYASWLCLLMASLRHLLQRHDPLIVSLVCGYLICSYIVAHVLLAKRLVKKRF